MSEGDYASRPENDTGQFPYAFTPAAPTPWCYRFRAEGLRPMACAINALRYLRKYRRKLYLAPREEIACFRAQHRLLTGLGEAPAADGDVRVAMVGDLMWIADGWRTFLHPAVLESLNAHPVVLGNLETAVSGSFRVSRPFPEFAWFNADPALVTSFSRPDGSATFTALATVNNHTLDYHDTGARDTLDFLEAQGILHSGVRRRAEEPTHVTFDAGGVRIGFYAASYGMNDPRRWAASRLRINVIPGLAPEGPARPDLAGVADALAAMRADGAEFRVVALHWGFEYEMYPTPRQMQVARDIVRAGADVILGTHPHVQQPVEVLYVNGYERLHPPQADLPPGCLLRDPAGRPRKAVVFYSLGNFVTAMHTFGCRVGQIQSLSLRRDPAGGGVDWHRPRARLVYNVRRDPAVEGSRRLALLEDWLGEHHEEVSDDLAFLRRHVVAHDGP